MPDQTVLPRSNDPSITCYRDPAGSNVSDDASDPSIRIVTGRSARGAATHMDLGNIVAVLLPVPLGILWLGVSMLVYALHKHHPNPKVGEYTQWAAYRLYGVMGAVVPVATFFPGRGLTHWLLAWAIAALILIPWSIRSLIRIRRDTWEDVVIPADRQEHADVR